MHSLLLPQNAAACLPLFCQQSPHLPHLPHSHTPGKCAQSDFLCQREFYLPWLQLLYLPENQEDGLGKEQNLDSTDVRR